MPNYLYDFAQGSEAWLEARLGIPTASEFDKIVTPGKLELSKSSRPYMCRKLAEWMHGAPLEAYDVGAHGWGARGKDLEAEAVRYYEMEHTVETRAVGLVLTGDGMVGASPDRLVGDDGLLELKCPSLEVHVGYMLDPTTLADEHKMQVQGQLWVCRDRTYCDLMSYYPGFPDVIVRCHLRELVAKAFDLHISAFIETMLHCRTRLTQEYGELRRERVTAQQRVEESRAAFDSFMESGIGGAA